VIYFCPCRNTFVSVFNPEKMKGKTVIKIKGHLDKKWKESFEDTEIRHEGTETVLTIDLKDEAHLHGVLNLVRDLNLKLISVNPDDDHNEHSI